MHRTRVGLGLVLLLGLSACDGDVSEMDAGADAGPTVDDAGPMEDGGPPPDAGPGDAGSPDGGPDGCETAGCGTDESCVRGVCLADCGADPSAFDTALAAGLTPIANFCRSAAVFGVAGEQAWDVTTSTSGTTTTFALSRWALDPTMTPPSPTEIATAEHTVGDGATLVFAGGYLEVQGTRALFGYTTSAAGSPGGVFVVDASTSPATVTELSAPSNFDAAWLDADAFVVNGQGLLAEEAGQGLYVADLSGSAPAATHVSSGPGEYSGSVAVTADYVLAGGADGGFASVVRAFDRDDVDAVTATPLDATSDGFAVTLPGGATPSSTFGALSPTRVLTTPFGGPLSAYTVAWSDATGLALSAPEELATGDTFTGILPAADDRLVFVHANGLLLVE